MQQSNALQQFISQKNLDHYYRLLAGNPDDAERVLLLRLIAEEAAALEAPSSETEDTR
jgi:hypothetical protein